MQRQSPESYRARPTIRDVSERAGVSTATVSRVLTGLGGASKETVRRIERVAREIGYQPNRMAQGLRATRSKLVGVVIPDLQNPFFTGIVGGIEEVLHQEGFTLFLSNSDESLEREQRELQTLRGERVSGALLIPCRARAPHYLDLTKSAMPVVTIDRELDEVNLDCVTSANESGARQAVAHLLRHGYATIGLVNGPAHYGVAREREAGYRQAFVSAGRRPRSTWMASGDFRIEGGYEATRAILSKPQRPRALFVANFLMALGALRAIRELGLQIPQDVALMTFDDMPWGAAMNPPLSTVAQPVRELGRTAATLLLERLTDPSRAVRRIVLETELVLRDSCGTRK